MAFSRVWGGFFFSPIFFPPLGFFFSFFGGPFFLKRGLFFFELRIYKPFLNFEKFPTRFFQRRGEILLIFGIFKKMGLGSFPLFYLLIYFFFFLWGFTKKLKKPNKKPFVRGRGHFLGGFSFVFCLVFLEFKKKKNFLGQDFFKGFSPPQLRGFFLGFFSPKKKNFIFFNCHFFSELVFPKTRLFYNSIFFFYY